MASSIKIASTLLATRELVFPGGDWQRWGSLEWCQCWPGLGTIWRLAAGGWGKGFLPSMSLQDPGMDHRWVGVPSVALLTVGAHGFTGDSSFLGRGDRTGLFP